MKNKTCYVCGKSKPKTMFYHDRSRYDGRQSRCKDCNRKEEKTKEILTNNQKSNDK